MTRRVLLLPIVLGVLGALGCGGAGDKAPSDTGPDSAAAVAPAERDSSTGTGLSASELAARTAVERLLRGDARSSTGDTWFSSATANALRSLSLDSTGHAIVDFVDLRAIIPNASSSAGSAQLLDELNATMFSVDVVRSVEYRMEGSCERFWEWLQYSCQTVRRP